MSRVDLAVVAPLLDAAAAFSAAASALLALRELHSSQHQKAKAATWMATSTNTNPSNCGVGEGKAQRRRGGGRARLALGHENAAGEVMTKKLFPSFAVQVEIVLQAMVLQAF